ncbi:MAG TPA: sugar transferase [Anaerolineales bacterium]|nr:sugar transferase [Anaerolineales bacterium]
MGALLFPVGIPKTKRVFDLVLTIPGFVVISPILGILGLLVRLRLGSPAIFRHRRPGLRGEVFTLYKFRTMTDAVGPDGRPLPDDERLTGLGRFMRATSLDELPELVNVLRGEMSLVGPRPLLTAYLERYTPEQARRHEVLPGMTGWAQVNGRNAITWEQKFAYDVWYVDHWSLGLDVRILALTAYKALAREGISQPGRATADEFMGSGENGKKGA